MQPCLRALSTVNVKCPTSMTILLIRLQNTTCSTRAGITAGLNGIIHIIPFIQMHTAHNTRNQHRTSFVWLHYSNVTRVSNHDNEFMTTGKCRMHFGQFQLHHTVYTPLNTCLDLICFIYHFFLCSSMLTPPGP